MKPEQRHRLDTITETLYHLTRGRIPKIIELTEDPDDEIRQLAGYVNHLIQEEQALGLGAQALAQGELDQSIEGQRAAIQSLKSLQAALKHLVWQTGQIAQGDFSQRVNFMGAFSESFNWMVSRLAAHRREMKWEIAERETAQRKAEVAVRIKGEFLAAMSHELRTPLNHIIGFTELIMGGHLGEVTAEQNEGLAHVMDSSRKLLGLINNVIELSRLEAGDIKLEPGPVDVGQLVFDCRSSIDNTARQQEIDITEDLDGVPAVIHGDGDKLQAAMNYLLANALQYTPQGGRIAILGRLRDVDPVGYTTTSGRCIKLPAQVVAGTEGGVECLHLIMQDSGIGIERENLELIFRPFERVDGSRTSAYPGAGLELSLARGYIELQGGRLWAESAGKHQGAAFHILLPLGGQANNGRDD